MNMRDVLTAERMSKMRRNGALFFDVDDTLLARRSGAANYDQIYSENDAAKLLPELLNAGVRVCIITGHGWRQLQTRLIAPFITDLNNRFSSTANILDANLFVYANRGATRIALQNGKPLIDRDYGRNYRIDAGDAPKLRSVVESMREFYLCESRELETDREPPRLLEREGVILGLRPILDLPAKNSDAERTARTRLIEIGTRLLVEQNLSGKYFIAASGTSTLELSRIGISKQIAFDDTIARIGEQTGLERTEIENSSVYVGDEFDIGGNDFVILKNYPGTCCLSVAPAQRASSFQQAISVSNHYGKSGTAATSALIGDILNSLK